MTITEIREWKKGKYLICLNDEPSFALYAKEIAEYELKAGEELEDGKYGDILDNVLIKRAKSRTLHLLDRNDKTEKELRDKLKDGMYPEEAIDAAVEAAKKGRFLDDRRYAAQYVYEKSRSKSRKLIEAELLRKGVAPEFIRDAFSELSENGEDDGSDREEVLILKLMKKRCPDPELINEEAKSKLYRYLCGKGFDFQKVKKVFDVYLQDASDVVY